jgi:hypothetical protein
MRQPGVSVTVTWDTCGEVNAYYIISQRRIMMCRELLTLPLPFVRFVFAHEYGHAIIYQLQVPYTGSGEGAADEVAAVLLSLYGDDEAVTVTADFWRKRNINLPPWAEHPDDDIRGWTLRRIARAHKDLDADWVRLLATWNKLLGYT